MNEISVKSLSAGKEASHAKVSFFSTLVAFSRAAWPLTKPTISVLVVFTAIPELLSKDAIAKFSHPWAGFSFLVATLLGIFLASASSAVFNHIIDADIDVTMQRTRNRPVPSGAVSQNSAIIFGITLGVLSFIILYAGGSLLAALLALAANIFYAWFYTAVLKRRTDQNIVIGGAAGAIGPLIGCAAISNSLNLGAWLQFLVIFLWTPPHFWALALKYQNDYRRANVPMLPVTRGDEVTRKHIFLYTLTLFPVIIFMWVRGDTTWLGGPVLMATTAYFSFLAYRLYRSRDNSKSMSLFIYSCFYLFIVFGSLALERVILSF